VAQKNAPLKKSGAAMKRMEKLLLDSKKHEFHLEGREIKGISLNSNQLPHQ